MALSLDSLRTSSLVPATTSSQSLCRLYMCRFPFPACFGIPACPAWELFPSFPLPIHAVGQSWQPWLEGQEELLSSHDLLLIFKNLTALGLDTLERERGSRLQVGRTCSIPSGEESPACRQGHLPTCTDIFYRHGCTCVDNMVF